MKRFWLKPGQIRVGPDHVKYKISSKKIQSNIVAWSMYINLWDFILTALQEGIKIFYDIFIIYKNPVLNIV